MTSVHCCEKGSRPRNEDSCFVDEAAGIYLISDGMGGHDDGQVASAAACEAASNTLLNDDPHKLVLDSQDMSEDELLKQFVGYAVQRANTEVLKRREQAQSDMGATLTAVLIRNGKCYCAHVGDGRVYLVKDGALSKVTAEHRVGKYVSRSLGEKKSTVPDLHAFEFPDNGAVVMGTDGFWDFVSEETALGAIQKRHEDEIARVLYENALANGTDDNVTVVVILGQKLCESKVLRRIEVLERRIKDKPSEKDAWEHLIKELRDGEMWHRLVGLVPKLLAAHSNNVEWLAAGAEACRRVGNQPVYVQVLERLHELRPKSDRVVKELAQAYCQAGTKTKRAREVCRRALTIEDNGQVRQFLAECESSKRRVALGAQLTPRQRAAMPAATGSLPSRVALTPEHAKSVSDLRNLRVDVIRLKQTLALLAVIGTSLLGMAAGMFLAKDRADIMVVFVVAVAAALGISGLWLAAFGMTGKHMNRRALAVPQFRHYGPVAAGIVLGAILVAVTINVYVTPPSDDGEATQGIEAATGILNSDHDEDAVGTGPRPVDTPPQSKSQPTNVGEASRANVGEDEPPPKQALKEDPKPLDKNVTHPNTQQPPEPNGEKASKKPSPGDGHGAGEAEPRPEDTPSEGEDASKNGEGQRKPGAKGDRTQGESATKEKPPPGQKKGEGGQER